MQEGGAPTSLALYDPYRTNKAYKLTLESRSCIDYLIPIDNIIILV